MSKIDLDKLKKVMENDGLGTHTLKEITSLTHWHHESMIAVVENISPYNEG